MSKHLLPGEYECVIKGRNRKWVSRIAGAHTVDGPVFFAVGVGHMLPGDGNLLDLLSAEGFKVTRVEPQ